MVNAVELEVIGDAIYLNGFEVAYISPQTPATVRATFESLVRNYISREELEILIREQHGDYSDV